MVVQPRRSVSLQHQQRLEVLVHTCAERAWRVAYSLLRDQDEAFDAVQQAFLVAASKPEQIPRSDPWPWFCVVVGFEARNMRRKKRPTPDSDHIEASGGVASRANPDDGVVNEERDQALWNAIQSLPVSERDAIVLTQMNGISHADAARILDMKVKTLSSHVTRGLDRLRQRTRSGDLKTLQEYARTLPVAALPLGGLDQAIGVWKASALQGLGLQLSTHTLTSLGGLMFVKKSTLALSMVCAIGLGAASGVVASQTLESQSNSAPAGASEASVDLNGNAAASVGSTVVPQSGKSGAGADGDGSSAADAMEAAALELQQKYDKLRSDYEAISREQQDAEARENDLRSQLAEIQKELAPLREERALAYPVFTFGEGGDLDAVKNEHWGQRAKASSDADRAIQERFALIAKGETPPRSLGILLQKSIERMRLYEYEALDKLPTNARHNGENLHPITQSNLIAATLRNGGLPLSDGQINGIQALGVKYEDDYAALQASYPDGTLRLQKIVDEMDLKQRFMNGVYSVLSQEQGALVCDPQFRGQAGLDLHCPTLLIFNTSPVLRGANASEVQAGMPGTLKQRYGLTDEQCSAASSLIQAWFAECPKVTSPVAAYRWRHYTYEESMEAGRATVSLLKKLRDSTDLALTDEQQQRIQGEDSFLIPRIIQAEEQKQPSGS